MKITTIALFLFIIIFVFLSCSEYTGTIWAGKTYTGTVTNDDTYDGEDYYYDMYYLGCAGTWKIDFESKDELYMLVTIWDFFGNKVFSKGTEDSFSVSTSLDFPPFDVYVNIVETNPYWEDNGYKADYSITMKFK
ncbi:hypothetical protein KAR91_75620 [Candidatus Pacearchaeota archaeon]|nr:hypothetical protein [Candidatus Pacearchaeota archaeon]